MVTIEKNKEEIKGSTNKKKNENEILIREEKREIFWDIVKGIGIISVVFGHVIDNISLQKFVYAYHLVIFYFVAAYFYNEEKYGSKPFEYFARRLKENWIRYFFYSLIIILLHNFFCKFNFYDPKISQFDAIKTFSIIFNSMTFQCPEKFAGSLWFVPTLIIALGIFVGIVYISRNISNFFVDVLKINYEDGKYIKYLFIFILSLVIGIVGINMNMYEINLCYHMETSLVAIPICELGYFFRIYKPKIKNNVKSYILLGVIVVSSMFMWYEMNIRGLQIELSKDEVINFNMFYIISIIGIIFCLSLAKIIENISIINKLLALIGKYSFSIMALHLLIIKLVDVIYSYIINETNPVIISNFVCTYPDSLLAIYMISGVILPMLIGILLNKLKQNKKIKGAVKKVH